MLKTKRTKVYWWADISDEEKSALEKGVADIKAGRVKPHQEARKIYEKWL